MERNRFPGTLELITGKFLRHSDAYYRWRIGDRTAKLSNHKSPKLYDDLAVSYDKLGEHQRAIATATECERLFPGRYETAANLGTFYIHAGDLDSGITHITRAIEINPDAHFGRERYQLLMVAYLLSKRANGIQSFPLDPEWPEEEYYEHQTRGFAKFCELDNADAEKPLDEDTLIAEVLRGVQGMMKFGNYDSPVLLEALGDVLLAGHRDSDTKRIAARAYLRAAEACDLPDASGAYRQLAAKAVEIHVTHDQPGMPPKLTVELVEKNLQAELQDANQWYAELVEREREWIDANKDVDAEFKRVYYNATAPRTESPQPWTFEQIMGRRVMLGTALLITMACIGFYGLRMLYRALSTEGET